MADRNVSEEDRRAREAGRILVFLVAGALSGLLLYLGYWSVTHGEPLGFLALVGSAVFWWPLFRLGVHHARKNRPPPEAP